MTKEDLKLIEMKKITKVFGDFTAIEDINLSVGKGEVHALLGENGAGKSTLMNILYGLFLPTSGDIYINGKEVIMNSPNVAIEHGIGMVHQHFMLIDTFTVVENIILGQEVLKGPVLDIKEATKKVEEISEKYGLYVDPHAKIRDITVGMQQRVEILKALYRGSDILILDEPTAVLTPQEIEELMEIMENLVKQGKTIIIITHKLNEIKMAADYCTIIRRGKYIDTVKVSEVSEADLAEKMVGREVDFKVHKKDQKLGESTLQIENLVVKDNRNLDQVKGLDLEIFEGEILGIAGIDGNGQSELIEAITGLRPIESGSVSLRGEEITNKTPFDIINAGISTIPEDRQRRGLVLDFTVAENMILENYYKEPFSKRGVLNQEEIIKFSENLIEKFDVRPNDPYHLAGELSGGNQQKVIISREITNNPNLLIAAQPTRGLDVGAIEYIHQFLVEQRNNGKAVLLVSFELDEVMSVSDRIAVIYEGKIVKILDAKDANENELGLLMAGGGKGEGE